MRERDRLCPYWPCSIRTRERLSTKSYNAYFECMDAGNKYVMIRNVHVDKAHEEPGHSVSWENLDILQKATKKDNPGKTGTGGNTSVVTGYSFLPLVSFLSSLA